ncbi:MAG: hypothetical protein ABIK96_05840 [bacterium]
MAVAEGDQTGQHAGEQGAAWGVVKVSSAADGGQDRPPPVSIHRIPYRIKRQDRSVEREDAYLV